MGAGQGVSWALERSHRQPLFKTAARVCSCPVGGGAPLPWVGAIREVMDGSSILREGSGRHGLALGLLPGVSSAAQRGQQVLRPGPPG